MNPQVVLALVGWIPITLVMFALMRPRKAVISSMVFGWLFLPEAVIKFSGMPNYDKAAAVSLAAFLGVAIFDPAKLQRFVPRWYDLPMAIWCLTPMATSLANGLGPYDGLSGIFDNTVLWGVPYLIGRVYLDNLDAFRDLAITIFISGLVYIPLCMYELKMSPQLHRMVYGFHPAEFVHTRRFGGWRPMVFMHGGLVLAVWMSSASLLGLVLWRSRSLKHIMGIPILWLLIPLWVTTLLCKSVGALGLMFVGVILYYLTKSLRVRAFILAAIAAVPIYLTMRIALDWHGEQVVDVAAALVNEKRAGSLKVRFDNEHLILEAKSSRFLLGWGGWNRNRVFNEDGKDITITDSLWIIVFGKFGFVGLVAVHAIMLLPIARMILGMPPRMLGHPMAAVPLALAVALWIFGMDKLLNAQPNPAFMFLAGGMICTNWRSIVLDSQRGKQLPQVRQVARVAHTPTNSEPTPPVRTELGHQPQ